MKIFIFTLLIINFSLLTAQTIRINEVMASNSSVIQDEDGDYSDWIELFNPTSETINLHNYSLSDDYDIPRKWLFPKTSILPNEYLLIFASGKDNIDSELHTNFKISASGEGLILTNNEEQIVNQLEPTPISTNVSLGRSISDPSVWLFFISSTPGEPNDNEGFTAFSESPKFSINEGFYPGSVLLELSTESGLNNIYYTTNGEVPTTSSFLYSSAISVDITTVIRVRVFAQDLLPSKIMTKTYLINEEFSLPVVSLSTDPENLWDKNIGIYVEGENGIIGNCMETPANWNQDWERPIHIELFEKDKNLAFSIDAGVQIHGGCSRILPQKSLAIVARGEYGTKIIPYKLFHDLPFDEYQSIILRNSGQDNWYSFMRDGFMHTLVKNLDLETMAYRPSIVFLNGEYWGIYNIRERTNKSYLARHHNVDEDNLDVLRRKTSVVEGDYYHYEALTNYLENNKISIDSNYEYVKTQMEVDNYINYLLSEMYFINTDWYPGNMKFWRPKTSEGRWRWILFDTDNGFDLYNHDNVDTDMTRWVSNEGRDPSVIFNNLILNENFKTQFVNSFTDLANTIFKEEVVLSIIDSIKSVIQLEIPKQITKWGRPWQQDAGINFWYEEIDRLNEFATARLEPMYQHFIRKFGLGVVTNLNLDINIQEAGKIKLNSIKLQNFPWVGKYFSNTPVKLEAIPRAGYKFVRWTGDESSLDRVITYIPTNTNNITAVFQENNEAFSITMNEIHYHSPDLPLLNSGDWVELYNNSDDAVDISGWVFKDSENNEMFNIPQETIIVGRGYLILCENFVEFSLVHPNVENIVGDFGGDPGFKFSNNGELLRLYNQAEDLIDSVRYNDKSPWPTSPDGNGPTLELKHPDLDNDYGANWSASLLDYGTPGKVNSSIQKKSLVGVTVFLEGAYADSNLMSNTISLLPTFPKKQPFNILPWNYTGAEEVLELPNSDIIDWVMVELRSETVSLPTNPRRAAFLKQNGSIVDLDGSSDLAFYDVSSSEYNIVVHHRNHLSVMSSSQIHIE